MRIGKIEWQWIVSANKFLDGFCWGAGFVTGIILWVKLVDSI